MPPARTYAVSGPDDITDEEFAQHFSYRLRASNAEQPDCKYIMSQHGRTEHLAVELLRRLGISSDRITLAYSAEDEVPSNPHHHLLRSCLTLRELPHTLLIYSTHDISWSRPGSPAQLLPILRRDKLLRTRRGSPNIIYSAPY